MLEAFQAGLSWTNILRKRASFREVFASFDPLKVAAFDEDDIERLMADPGIVRARAKIVATIRGAQVFNDMQASGEDFAAYCRSVTSGIPVAGVGHQTQSELSARISKEPARCSIFCVSSPLLRPFKVPSGVPETCRSKARGFECSLAFLQRT